MPLSSPPSPLNPSSSVPAAQTPRLTRLLRESRWLVFVTLAAYLVLILATYQRGDPAWSHSAGGLATSNAGGRIGALVSDVLLYLFGLSAWWLVALLAYLVIAGYKRLAGDGLASDGLAGKALAGDAPHLTDLATDQSAVAGATVLDRRSLFAVFGGFALLLACGAALESLRLYTLKAQLPLAPGGMLGDVAGKFAETYLGFTGATLVLDFVAENWGDVGFGQGAVVDFIIPREIVA